MRLSWLFHGFPIRQVIRNSHGQLWCTDWLHAWVGTSWYDCEVNNILVKVSIKRRNLMWHPTTTGSSYCVGSASFNVIPRKSRFIIRTDQNSRIWVIYQTNSIEIIAEFVLDYLNANVTSCTRQNWTNKWQTLHPVRLQKTGEDRTVPEDSLSRVSFNGTKD